MKISKSGECKKMAKENVSDIRLTLFLIYFTYYIKKANCGEYVKPLLKGFLLSLAEIDKKESPFVIRLVDSQIYDACREQTGLKLPFCKYAETIAVLPISAILWKSNSSPIWNSIITTPISPQVSTDAVLSISRNKGKCGPIKNPATI